MSTTLYYKSLLSGVCRQIFTVPGDWLRPIVSRQMCFSLAVMVLCQNCRRRLPPQLQAPEDNTAILLYYTTRVSTLGWCLL